jgi:hypothetical protein
VTDHNEHFWAAVGRLFKRRFPLVLGGVLTIGWILGTARFYGMPGYMADIGSLLGGIVLGFFVVKGE